jgi:photosystem II stability/assembly factor-like uncharacterized protein
MKYFMVLLALVGCLTAYNYHGCALAPDNLTGWVVCIDTALIFITTDGGATWTQPPSLPTGTNRFYDVNGASGFLAWTSGDLGQVLNTTDGGSNWVIQPIVLSKNATRIFFLNANEGWVVGGNGTVGRTTDGGNSWEQNFTPHYQAEYYGLSFTDNLHGWIVAGYPDSLAAGQGYIDRSTDGGINWDSLYRSTGYEDFYDIRFLDNSVGALVGGNENDYSPIIWRSTNGGVSWSSVGAPANAYYLRALDFSGDHGWAVGRFGSIIRTLDQGNTWSFQTNPATTTLFDVDFSDTLHGLACGQNIILYTTDGGQNWNPSQIEENDVPAAPSRLALQIFPNPAHGRIEFMLDPGKELNAKDIALNIYDISGQVVRSLTLCSAANHGGPSALCWNGCDQLGHKVPAGIYFIRMSQGETTAVNKFVFLK